MYKDKIFSIQLLKNDGNLETIETQQSLIFIGANGSGKTRLGAWIEFKSSQRDRVHRISAQKSLAMPHSTTLISMEKAENGLLYGYENIQDNTPRYSYKSNSRWQNKPATILLNDYDKLLAYLFSDQVNESIIYTQVSKNSKQKIKPPTTRLDKVKQLWEKILPSKELIIGNQIIQTQIKGSANKPYNASEMSDGERVIFYLIGQCLSVPKDGIIIIDEPEIHLHKSVQVTLWREIQNYRPDCFFIYMTHDIDFAVALSDSKKIWLKSYDGTSWDWEEVPEIEGVPEKLLIEILGSRKSVVFVEGANGSNDVNLYRAVLNDFLVIPCGSCSKVIQIVKALTSSNKLHHMDVFGVIDRDRRLSEEINSLMKKGIYTLEVAEVENLFCVPEIIGLVSKILARNPNEDIETAKNYVIEKISSELNYQISLHVASKIRYKLRCFEGKAVGAKKLKKELDLLIANIKIDDLYADTSLLFNKAVTDKDYLAILKLYNRKSLASQIGSQIGLLKDELAELVVRLANGDKTSEVKKALKPYFGKFSNKIN